MKRIEPVNFPRRTTSGKASATQIGIIDAYLRLMAEKDFDKVSVLDIVREAGITRSTFYAYFSDIYDVIGYVENSLAENMPCPDRHADVAPLSHDCAPDGAQCMIPAWLDQWFDYVVFFRWQLGTLLGPHGNAQFPHKIRKQIRKAQAIQMGFDGFGPGERRDWFLNAISDFQLRMIRDIAAADDDTAATMAREYAFLCNSIRVGGMYMRHLDEHEGVNLAEMR